MNQGVNIYRPSDAPAPALPRGQRVFLSHRNPDKPVVRAIASVLSSLDVHYWLDEEDLDLQRAVALGMVGDMGVVHAIERGVRHATAVLGLLSRRTEGSWWVPYEIGHSRGVGKTVCFLVLGDARERALLPEYVRMAATYWSVDELARWASGLAGHDLHSNLSHVPEDRFLELAKYLPLMPPEPDLTTICSRALDAIELLARPEVQETLALTTDRFDWLPTAGGPVREIAYDLFAPLACYRLGQLAGADAWKEVEAAYLAPTRHYEVSRQEPPLPYGPEVEGWRHLRYRSPGQTWLQGLKPPQLVERVTRFLTTRDRTGQLRLATREEFKAEFDRILGFGDEHARRSLGVLVNPLFGFTPRLRPVFWRVLAIQYLVYSKVVGRGTGAIPFDQEAVAVARRMQTQLTPRPQ
jgi:hypothetical protein